MRAALAIPALIVCISLSVFTIPAEAYQLCEKYEYAELKSMSAKQLEAEYCKVEQRVNEMYQFIGVTSLNDDPRTDQAVLDRDVCWDAMDKMRRQPRFKLVKTACPGVKRVDPLEAAAEQSERNLEQMQRQYNKMR